MADLKPIENYIPTEWRNYIPPSIDQDKLNHLEENVKMNRDIINEIIKRLGIKPSSVSAADNTLYNTPIYETLIAHRNELERLEADKLDIKKYNTQLGDFTKLQGGSTLVDAINNRLRRDIDDSAMHQYTFKKLILSNGTSSALEVTGSATISKSLSVAGITSSALVKSTAGMETTTLKASGASTFGNTVTVTGRIIGNGGTTISNGANITGGLTIDNLAINGTITCAGDATFRKNITSNETITGKNITAQQNLTCSCNNSGDLIIYKNSILLGKQGTPTHRLWVQGAKPSLGDGDVALLSKG